MYGAQQSTDPFDSTCGNGKHTNGTQITGNAPSDTSVPQDGAFDQAMVAHLVQKFGTAAQGGVRSYEIDNEPTLWNSTHIDVHPTPLSYDELWQKSLAAAQGIKAADPSATVDGPGDWGWCAYFYAADDPGGCGPGPDKTAHGNLPLAAWYLQQFAAYNQSHGQRLLDYFDEHFYPQEAGVALSRRAARQRRRCGCDRPARCGIPTYTDESWTADLGLGSVNLIPRMQQWVAQYYPGTKTAISEYNWGGLESINGALAQADVLGIFGRQGLDRAQLWSPPSSSQPGAFAFRMYRDYDGHGSRFGDESVSAIECRPKPAGGVCRTAVDRRRTDASGHQQDRRRPHQHVERQERADVGGAGFHLQRCESRRYRARPRCRFRVGQLWSTPFRRTASPCSSCPLMWRSRASAERTATRLRPRSQQLRTRRPARRTRSYSRGTMSMPTA